MIGYLLIAVSGLLGSSHCLGMCGGFALALGAGSRGWARALVRQVVYGLGRVFTYTIGGAAAGWLGRYWENRSAGVVEVQALLCLAAGLLLLVQGLSAVGWLRLAWLSGRNSSCCWAELFGSLLRDTRAVSVFLGGVLNGLLPCGLVYAFLALAATAGSLSRGALTMFCFGLGTIPVLAGAGMGGALLGATFRHRLLTVAGWCLVLTGVLTLSRGFGFLSWFRPADQLLCPFCETP